MFLCLSTSYFICAPLDKKDTPAPPKKKISGTVTLSEIRASLKISVPLILMLYLSYYTSETFNWKNATIRMTTAHDELERIARSRKKNKNLLNFVLR